MICILFTQLAHCDACYLNQALLIFNQPHSPQYHIKKPMEFSEENLHVDYGT